MEQVFTTNWVFRQSSAPVQMKEAEDNYEKAQALVYSLCNLTLFLLGPGYWMPSVYLIQYSVSSTETPGISFLRSEGKGMEQASEREAGQGGARSLLHRPFCIMATPHSPPFLLRVTACPSFPQLGNKRRSCSKICTVVDPNKTIQNFDPYLRYTPHHDA